MSDIARCIEASPSVSVTPVFPDENTTLINGMNTVNTIHDEGTVVFDILFAAMIPSSKPMRLIINVETQADFSPHYPLPSRAEYYSARLITHHRKAESLPIRIMGTSKRSILSGAVLIRLSTERIRFTQLRSE